MKQRFAFNLFGFVLLSMLLSIVFAVACGGSSARQPSNTVLPADSIGTGAASRASGVLPPTATPTPPGNEFQTIGQPEPFMLDDLELVGLDGWINSRPLTLGDLADSGRVVLLDFWTYTCVNCVRTFPYLTTWHDLYAEYGLTVIGVHSPEFDFEKIPANVQAAVKRYGIEYPVALDSDKQTWDKYGNHFWPSKYLISDSGEVIFRHFGEGGYRETESLIREALTDASNDLAGAPGSNVVAPARSTGAHTITREIYGGYSNGYLSDGLYAGQDAYYVTPDVQTNYVDDGTRRAGQFFLEGQWLNSRHAIVSGEGGEHETAYLVFEFFATSVNAVLGADTTGLEAVVELDGRPLTSDEAGADISWDASGNSVLKIDETRLYQIVELPAFGKRELKLKTNSEGLAIYTVTFGVSEFGP